VIGAVRAACEVGADFGILSREPLVVQETNNTVVWLRPEPVIAKVAIRADSQVDVHLEHAVASELAALDAETVRPMPATTPRLHPHTGFVVTLWQRLEGTDRTEVPSEELASSLDRLHQALAETRVALPSFRQSLARARTALDNNTFMAALASDDRGLLRNVFDDGLLALDSARFDARRLHGEPHDGNRIATKEGLRWIDFESCCIGPLEWDLAFQSRDIDRLFPDADDTLLALLRRLNSARVATWCCGQTRFPGMRQHGEIHLALLRQPTTHG